MIEFNTHYSSTITCVNLHQSRHRHLTPAVYRQIITGIDWCTPEIIDQHLSLSGGQ